MSNNIPIKEKCETETDFVENYREAVGQRLAMESPVDL
jgi:hypothetical protein